MTKNDSSIIKNAFKPWRVYLAILLGIGIIGWMLYHNLNKPYFIYDPRNGTHEWLNVHFTEEIDPTDEHQFIEVKGGDYRQQQFLDLITEMNWTMQSAFWIFLAVCFMVGRDLFYMFRIKTLTKNELSWKQSFNVIMLWEFASALSPGVVGGSAVAMFILNREKIELGRSTSIVIITALMDNLFFLLMVPIVLFCLGNYPLFSEKIMIDSNIKWMFWLAYSGIFMISLILLISIFIYPQLIKNILHFLFKIPFLKRWKDKAEQTGEEIMITSKVMRGEKKSFWLKVGTSTFLSWFSRYLVINCLIAAFVHLTFSEHLLVLGKQLILWIIMLVSPTPGGSGIAEFAFGKIMNGIGISALVLTGIIALWRLISYFPYLLIGVIILPRWLRRKDGFS